MNLRSYVLFKELLPKSPTGTYQALSPADGVARQVGYVSLQGEPLVALASIGRSTRLGLFWKNVYRVIGVFVAIMAILALTFMRLISGLRREEKQSDDLEKALANNQLLLQEVNHRIKNNLHIVSSMIHLEDIPGDRKTLLFNRIEAIAAIHEQAYRSDQYAEIELSRYIATLLANLRGAFGADVKITEELQEIVVDRDKALPVGLLTNELVTNSLKHAFPDGRPGTVNVSLTRIGQTEAELIVQDDGVGLIKEGKSSGIGSRLIHGFVSQLKGTSETLTNGGTIFKVRFPI
jgi:two-component sensor histidine kinase